MEHNYEDTSAQTAHRYENTPAPSRHLLDDIDPVQLTQASGGQRFVNYIVDRIVVFLLWRGILLVTRQWLATVLVSREEHAVVFSVEFLTLWVAFDVLTITAMEYLSGGKTLGKLFSGTRAVTANGSRLTLEAALLRSLCRFIPFDNFSALGSPPYPWHDSLTKTLVVDERRSTLPAKEA